ncbi:hypothetical protein V6N11_077108 [Hibiscus sabdariffa]|uniref:Reverse transcriptase n=1 Tax=Hibiscus sabdariffa TaxID=183260 RepID=A0ABR2TCF5_9ROSI
MTLANDYFSKLFSGSSTADASRIYNLIQPKISNSMNDSLNTEFQSKEIYEAVKSMAPLKASGPDGFPALFFQKFWHIVGDEVMDSGHSLVADLIDHNLHQWKESTVRLLFSEDQALHILNMLIPSVDTPDKIIWRADRSGSYSVRSGYRFLIGATEGISTSPASHYEDEIKSLY